MSAKAQRSSIFDRTDPKIAGFLGIEKGEDLKRKSVSRALKPPDPSDDAFAGLISGLYDCIASNRSCRRAPSSENWRCNTITTLSDRNKSPEVLLERAVATLSEAGKMPGWTNQVPVASGLVDDRSDKRAAIDLVKLEDNAARFVELKWESDTPAYAAIEILRYGLVYLFSRVNATKFGYSQRRLMRVDRVDLQVAAPSVFFDKHDLAWLESGLDGALARFSSKKTSGRLTMGIGFLALPRGFELPFRDGAEVKAACSSAPAINAALPVRDAFESLTPVWPDAMAKCAPSTSPM